MLLRMLLAIVDVVPLAVAEGLARFLSDVFFVAHSERRAIAIANIKRADIAVNDAHVRRIARESTRHLALLVVESIKSKRFFNESNWRDKIELDIPDETMTLLQEEGRGVLLVSGHLGSWEVAAQLLSYLKPVTAITRNMKNPYSNKFMLKRKSRKRLTLTPKHSADGARFLNVLKNGEMLALLNDQYASEKGMEVQFFGEPAQSHTAVALLHFITKVPICFGYCVRTGRMSFKFKILKPLMHKPTGDRKADTRAVLEILNRWLEDAIREYPEQYLWLHRRWKSRVGRG